MKKIWHNVIAARARRHFCAAKSAMEKGDMRAASTRAMRAAKAFRRCGLRKEEGEVCTLLGIICALSGNHDTAYFLFRSALEIFQNIKHKQGVKEIRHNLEALAASSPSCHSKS